MKKIIGITVFVCLLFAACAKNKVEQKDQFLKDFQLDLADWDLDLTKPQTIEYSSTVQRDSILNQLAGEFSESFQDPSSEIDSLYNKVLVSVGKEPQKVIIQVQKDSNVNFSEWNDLGICADAKSLNEKMLIFLNNNQAADFGVEYVSESNNFKLYANK